MNNKSIVFMIAIILAMGLGIYLNQRGSVSTRDDQIGKLLFPGLKAKLDKVQEVKFASNQKTVTIEHKGEHWTIEQKGGYEADFGKLSSFLNGLVKAKYVERKTSKPDNFSILGVRGIDDSASKATEVSVTASDGSQYQLLIGKNSETEKGHFVRKPSQSQVWLVDGVEEASTDAEHWIEPVVLSIDADEVSSVTDTTADGKHTLTVKRDKDSHNFKIEDLPKGARLKYDSIADSLARSLSDVRATDVRARGQVSWKQTPTASYVLKDGSTIVVHGLKDDNGRYWLRFDLDASKKPSEAVSFIDKDRLSGFEFRVPDYVYEQFTHTMDDMIKKEDKSADKTADKKAASAAAG